jgi:hypothetical protein
MSESSRSQPGFDECSLASADAEPSAARRVQLSRAKGWQMPPNTMKVDRSTRWGNPYMVERHAGEVWSANEGWRRGWWSVRRLGIGEWFYRSYLTQHDALTMSVEQFRREAASGDFGPLRGKNLACWCALDKPCHADVLLELANLPEQRGPTDAQLGPGTNTSKERPAE